MKTHPIQDGIFEKSFIKNSNNTTSRSIVIKTYGKKIYGIQQRRKEFINFMLAIRHILF